MIRRVYKVLLERNGQLYSPMKIPKELVVTYPVRDWVRGINNTPLFVYADKEIAISDKTLIMLMTFASHANPGEWFWTFSCEYKGLDYISESPAIWYDYYHSLDREEIDQIDQFWNKFRLIQNKATAEETYTHTLEMQKAWRGTWGWAYSHIVDTLKLAKPLMVCGRDRNTSSSVPYVVEKPTAEDLKRIGL